MGHERSLCFSKGYTVLQRRNEGGKLARNNEEGEEGKKCGKRRGRDSIVAFL